MPDAMPGRPGEHTHDSPPARLRVDLNGTEAGALLHAAVRDLRSIPDQARHLIREGLIRDGSLVAEDDR